MSTHLFGNDASKRIRAIHLQMDLICLVAFQVAILGAGRIIEDKLLCITFTHRNHEIRDHFAHVDKRNLERIGNCLCTSRKTSIAVVDLRRGIVIATANRAHDNRVSALGLSFFRHRAHRLRKLGFVAFAHVIDTELDDRIITRLQFFHNAVARRTSAFPEHVVVAIGSHAALAAVHDRRLVDVEPVMKILALTLLRAVALRPILHGGIATHVDSDFSHR